MIYHINMTPEQHAWLVGMVRAKARTAIGFAHGGGSSSDELHRFANEIAKAPTFRIAEDHYKTELEEEQNEPLNP